MSKDQTSINSEIHIDEIRGQVDIGIMTIREDEFLAVLDRFPSRSTVISDRRYYEFAHVATKSGANLGVVIVRFPEQGHGVAQGVARDLIEDLNPPWLFLVGIGGGIPDGEYSLGDVILATRLHDFSVSAAIQDERSEFNVAGGPMHQDVEALLAHLPALNSRLKGWNTQKSIGLKKPPVNISGTLNASEYYGSEDWKNKVRSSLEKNFPYGRKARAPKYHTGPMISSNTLVKDTNLVKQWQESARHTAAVEMELGGVYLAARHGGNRDYRVLAIRGLSDIVGFKRSGDWTTYACHSAAAFTYALILSGVITSKLNHNELTIISLQPSLHPQFFKTLDSVLDRGSEFFPSKELFEEDLIYFPKNEHNIMQKVQHLLTDASGERIALIYGDPASGKTVMGLTIAKNLQQQGYLILYYKLTANSSFDQLRVDLDLFRKHKILFVVDDCHLNLAVATNIYYRFDELQGSHAACLLISRKLPPKLRYLDEFDNLDIFEKLENQSFELDIDQDQQVFEKMSGIIERYQLYYERTTQQEYIIGDEERIIHNVRRNYLTLYFYLSFWLPSGPLDQLDEKGVLEKVYFRYLDNDANRAYMEVFLKYAALYQYEIQFEPNHSDLKAVEALTSRGLMEYDTETEYYSFYHSDFAKLLLKSYASRPRFTRNFNSLQDFTIQNTKTYILSFEKYPDNLSEVFLSLVMNKGSSVFEALLKDPSIKELTILYYHQIKSVFDLSRFLSIVARNVPQEIKIFSIRLTIDHPSIKVLFLETPGTLPPFVSIFKILSDVNNTLSGQFMNLFDFDERRQIVLNIDFHIICSYLSALRKSDPDIAQLLLEPIKSQDIKQKAATVNFERLAIGLNELKNVDPAKTNQVFGQIELSILVENAKAIGFERLTKGLSELKNIDSEKAKQVLNQIELSLLVKKAVAASFQNLGRALNELKNINPEKAKQVCNQIESSLLVEKAAIADFEGLGQTLNNLKNIDSDKAKQVLDQIELSLLVEKAMVVSFHNLGSGLNVLKNIDLEKVKQVLDQIELSLLVEKAAILNFDRLGQALNNLKNIDPEKAKQIFDKIELSLLVKKATIADFEALGQALNNLKNID
ncbi:MAG: hypothetical protein CV087_09260, partial [Candidatus Brocadia sp. WS118]